MTTWPRALRDLLDIEHPIVQAPMAGFSTPTLAAAVSNAGGLGSLGCATLDPARLRASLREIRAATNRPVNPNFFIHPEPAEDPARRAALLRRAGNRPAEPATAAVTAVHRGASGGAAERGGGPSEFPLRPARPREPAGAAAGARQGPELRHHGRRSALARGARGRSGDRPGATRRAAIAARSRAAWTTPASAPSRWCRGSPMRSPAR
jgi:Nitronate monooxygenase